MTRLTLGEIATKAEAYLKLESVDGLRAGLAIVVENLRDAAPIPAASFLGERGETITASSRHPVCGIDTPHAHLPNNSPAGDMIIRCVNCQRPKGVHRASDLECPTFGTRFAAPRFEHHDADGKFKHCCTEDWCPDWDENATSAAPAAPTGEREALREALADARDALDRDRTGLAAALNAIRKEVAGRYWMEPDGGWANYSWEEHTSDTLRKEIGWAFEAIAKIAKDALTASGTIATVGVRAASDALPAPAAPPTAPARTTAKESMSNPKERHMVKRLYVAKDAEGALWVHAESEGKYASIRVRRTGIVGQTFAELADPGMLPVVTDCMQGVDCPDCEDGAPHRHAAPDAPSHPEATACPCTCGADDFSEGEHAPFCRKGTRRAPAGGAKP